MHAHRMKAYAIRYSLAVAAAWPLAAPALASTIDRIDAAVQTAVEEQAVEQATTEAASRAEEQVAAQVENAAVDRVENSVASRVTDTAAEQVEASVTSGVANRVAEAATERTTESVASKVSAAAEERVRNVVGDSTVGRVVEGTGAAVADQVRGAGGAAAGALGQLPPQAADAAAAAVENARPAAAAAAGKPGGESAAVPAFFGESLDPQGHPIERDVLVLLVPHRDMAAVRALGMNLRRERVLPGLNRVLVRLEVEPGLTLGQAAALVRRASAATTVDYNHLYDLNAAPAAAPAAASGPDMTAGEDSEYSSDGAGPAMGVIDTAIETEHPALAGARIVQRDFIGAKRPRSTAHGTAIASILVQEGRSLSGAAPDLYAANVFFERAPGADTATTESIVAALGWLLDRDVEVVNMSLTGPANDLLQLAVERAAAAGTHVVAAVGNNGPAGEPLYPAAYEQVIGVTAVDGSEQAFMYANRGRQVMFAAPGVGVRVANSGGGYAQQDGTSLAAAHAAVIIATSLNRVARAGLEPLNVVDRLQRDARDLGPSGFDEVFGYGLIAPLDI